MAAYSWEQNLFDSFYATTPFFTLFLFFSLLDSNFPIQRIEKIFVGFGIMYIGLFIFQFLNPNYVYFGNPYVNDNLGINRIVFPGGGLFIITTFYALIRFSDKTKNNNNNFLWLIFFIICGIVILLQVTRQMILAYLLISVYHFSRHLKLKQKILVSVSMILIISLIYFYNDELKIQITDVSYNLVSKTESNFSSGIEEYVRYVSASFFIKDFSPNLISRIFGNGVPRYGVSDYGSYYEYLNTKFYYMGDVGIIGFYAMFGLIGVISILLIFYKSFTIRLPERFYYVKYYIWYLLITSLTSDAIFHFYYLGATAIALFIYQTVVFRNKPILLNEKWRGK